MFWVSAGRRVSVQLLRSWTPLSPLCPLQTSRLLCLSAPLRSPPGPAVPPLQRLVLEVSPFSTLRALLGRSSISIQPLDPHRFPEADRAFITVHGSDTEQEQVCLDHVKVHYDEEKNELQISAEKLRSSVCLDVSAPIKSNVIVTAEGEGNVQVRKMECDICRVQMEKGSCLLHSIRSHHVEVRAHGGQVRGAGTIHGNVDISVYGDGTVDVKKLQGTKMNVSTERGPLKVKAVYAESSCFSSCSGRVELGNVHGDATVTNGSGDTVIDGSNRFLKVSSQSGSIDVYVGDGGSAELHSQEGSVCVRVPSSLKAGLELCGTSVDISPEIVLSAAENNTADGQTAATGYMNAASPVEQWVKARADRSSVTLKTQSWFESLKLKS